MKIILNSKEIYTKKNCSLKNHDSLKGQMDLQMDEHSDSTTDIPNYRVASLLKRGQIERYPLTSWVLFSINYLKLYSSV